MGIAAGPFLIMQLPGAKVPLISGLYRHLPTWLPRTIHPNYLGGTLAFFFPATLGAFIGEQSLALCFLHPFRQGLTHPGFGGALHPRGHAWRVVVEPDPDDEILMIVTAYPEEVRP